jgi:alpha-mannosidase
MSIRGTIAILLLAATPALGATVVDRLVERLDALTRFSLEDWKASPDLKTARIDGDAPARPDFDDSRWDTLKLDEKIYPDSCWLRKTLVLPETYLGRPVRGPARLLLTVDDAGSLFVNGESKGTFAWDGAFDLAADVKPKDRFVIAIKAVNTGGPLRILRAELHFQGEEELRRQVEDLSLSLRVGQKLLGFDTYQTSSNKKVDPGTDASAVPREEKVRLGALLEEIAGRVDAAALERGEVDRFLASLEAARAALRPVGAFARRFTLFFDANAHIDAAWLWRERETVEVCKNTFSSVLNMFDARPDFTYTQSSAAYYDWMQRRYPDLFLRIREKIREGRWEAVGGMWIEPDCNLPSGDSWARHLLYGKRYFRDELGVDVTIGWNPDSFGYNWNMPQFYRQAGIDAFITQKIGWNAVNVFPHRVFWWEAPDGSRVLSYFPFDYVDTVQDPYRLVDWLRQFEANTGFRKMLVLFGVGDHGGGPSLEMLDRVDRLRSLTVFPAVEYGTAGRYLAWLRSRDLSKLPVWKDELYLEYHEGTFTTQARMKEWNRRSETELTNAEKFSTLATLTGGIYDGAGLQEAWKHVLFNQFHDILPGSGIREVYVDAPERYRAAEEIATHDLDLALRGLARAADTSKAEGTPVVVFNPLAWERRDAVRIGLPPGDEGEIAVFDARGREVPSQVVPSGRYSREVLFVAGAVPPLGYAVYDLRRGKPGADSPLRISEGRIENEFFAVGIDPASGWVKSIVDKRNGKEILAGPGNELQLLEDRPSAWDAWNIGLTGTRYPSTLRSLEVVERGPARAVLRLKRDFLKPGVKKDFPTEDFPTSFFTQDIVLHAGIDRIDFVTTADWWEEKTMLKVAFPVTVADALASYEIPFGSIARPTGERDSWEKAKREVPVERWADLSQDDYGVSLLNRSKYGYDIKGSTMRLSLLRSPLWPDPTADRGAHTIEYALYPHAGRWRAAGTARRGAEYGTPLLAVATDRHPGSLPPEKSFVSLGPDRYVLASIKRAEDSDAWVVRWYESRGEPGTAELALPFTPRKVVTSNFLEEDGEPVPSLGSVVKVPTPPNAVVTVKVFP